MCASVSYCYLCLSVRLHSSNRFVCVCVCVFKKNLFGDGACNCCVYILHGKDNIDTIAS